MLPLAGVLSVKATHAVTTSGSLSPQYVASWCQETKPGLRASFVKKDVFQHKISGPITSSTASRMAGCRTSSASHVSRRWGLMR